jgi:hypothetical protein
MGAVSKYGLVRKERFNTKEMLMRQGNKLILRIGSSASSEPTVQMMFRVQCPLQGGLVQHAAIRRPNAQCWWRRERLLAKDDLSERGHAISDKAAEATRSSARGIFFGKRLDRTDPLRMF